MVMRTGDFAADAVVTLARSATVQGPLTADSVLRIAAELTTLSHRAVALNDTE